MKKSLVFLASFLIFSTFLFCYELALVSKMESIYLAQNWITFINKIPLEGKLGEYQIKFIEQVNHKGYPLCEIYHLYPRGHILIPSYKEFPPIKSFSVISDFDSNSKGYEYVVLEELKAAFEFLHSYSLGESKELEMSLRQNFIQWNRFVRMDLEAAHLKKLELESKKSKIDKKAFILEDEFGLKLEAINAPPLLETKWGQGWPFWNFCPLLAGERCPVGCGSTSIAQIMRYYKWPKEGEGSHSYYWDNGNKWLDADFRDSYDWNYMPNEYWEYDTDREEDAVAEICYELGVAVNTAYHPSGSGSNAFDVVSALKKYFKYSNDARLVFRMYYGSLNEWFEVLKTQRDLLRPVEFSMYPEDFNPEGGIYGHSAVIDGYLIIDELRQVHINMGWYGNNFGNYDTYYSLDSILDFTKVEWQAAIIDIFPEGTQYTLTLSSGIGGTTNPAPGEHIYDKGTEVTVTAIPDTHYKFNGWSGNVPSGKQNDNPLAITMNSDKSLTASFLRIIYPPLNFAGEKVLNYSLSQDEYISTLTWEANPNNENIEKYRIYQIEGGSRSLLVELDANTFKYWHRNVEKDKQYTYALIAVNNENREGDAVYISVK